MVSQKIHIQESEKFPKYNLFAYSEGRLTEAARNMQFNGAPVIFVPGNGGSYKQARSFASVALRKGLEENWQKHLDFFTGLIYYVYYCGFERQIISTLDCEWLVILIIKTTVVSKLLQFIISNAFQSFSISENKTFC